MSSARPNFDDPSLWERHEAVIWDEHEEKDAHGNLVARFTKSDLDRICKNQNERARKNLFCPVTIGHTRPGQPETTQPPIVGYALNYQVVYRHDLQKHCITCSYYLKKEFAAEAKKYPRSSVEYWRNKVNPQDDFFDPICIGVQTPRLDIPPWTYQAAGYECSRYSMETYMAEKKKKESPVEKAEDKGEKIGEEKGALEELGKESPVVPEVPPPSAKEGLDPSKPPDAEAPEPEFHENFMRSMCHAYPHMAAMHAQYQKELDEGVPPNPAYGQEPAGDAMAGAPAGEPKGAPQGEFPEEKSGKGKPPFEKPEKNSALSATNGAMPAPIKSTKHQMGEIMDPVVADEISKLKTQLAISEARSVKAEERAAKTDLELSKYVKLYQRSERSKDIQRLADSGIILDVEEELNDIEGYGPDQYQRHLAKIKNHYQKDITSGDMVEVAAGEGAADAELSVPELEKARQYMRKNPGCGWDEAEVYARKR